VLIWKTRQGGLFLLIYPCLWCSAGIWKTNYL